MKPFSFVNLIPHLLTQSTCHFLSFNFFTKSFLFSYQNLHFRLSSAYSVSLNILCFRSASLAIVFFCFPFSDLNFPFILSWFFFPFYPFLIFVLMIFLSSVPYFYFFFPEITARTWVACSRDTSNNGSDIIFSKKRIATRLFSSSQKYLAALTWRVWTCVLFRKNISRKV